MNNTAAVQKRDHVFSKGWFGLIWKMKVAYAFVLPYMLLFMVFTVLPVLISICLSFTSFNILQPPKFVFMDNYINLFASDDVFTIALKNTLIVAAISGPLSYLLSYMFAWMINELRPIVRSIVTLIFYAPSIVGNMYVIWTILFSGDSYGYINGFLIRLGIIAKPILWLKDPNYMMIVLIIIVLWSSLGTSFLAFIAGFQGVDKSLYEAAAVDGITNRWQELWYITLPSMRPQLMFGAVMSITSSFGVGAVVTQIFGFPSADYQVHTIINHLEDFGGQRFEMGYASAIAVVLFVLMMATNLIIKRFLSKVGG